MSDYIKREDAISKIYSDFEVDSVSSTRTFGCIANIIDSLSEMPAADVVERPRWIPITERLPENEVPVLATYIGYCTGEQCTDLLVVLFEGMWCYWDGEPCSYDECKVKITHWMPLPELPKEG